MREAIEEKPSTKSHSHPHEATMRPSCTRMENNMTALPHRLVFFQTRLMSSRSLASPPRSWGLAGGRAVKTRRLPRTAGQLAILANSSKGFPRSRELRPKNLSKKSNSRGRVIASRPKVIWLWGKEGCFHTHQLGKKLTAHLMSASKPHWNLNELIMTSCYMS